MTKFITIVLVIVSLIHILPVVGVLGSDRLLALYGVSIQEQNNIEILLRHRAVLLGLIGMLLLYSAFNPAVQLFTIIVSLVSTLSFIWLAWSVGSPNLFIQKVALIDWVASGLLLVVLIIGLKFGFEKA